MFIDIPVFLLGFVKWLAVIALATFAPNEADPTLLLVLMLCGAAQMGLSLVSNITR